MNPGTGNKAGSSPRTVGLLGGTFDPPTVAHLVVADWVRQELGLEQVWFIPAHLNPLKMDREITSDELRLEMVRAAIAGFDAFRVKTLELERGGASFTIDTLRTLQQDHPATAFHLVLGSDAFLQMQAWKEVGEIFKRAEVVVVTRPKVDLSAVAEDLLDRVKFLDIPEIAISSTLVRERVREGWDVRALVPGGVAEIIARHGLYRP